MYLSKLDLKQKKAFLDACIHIIKADGVIARVELDLLEEFCNEMNIKSKRIADKDFDAAIVELNAVSNNVQRKEILIELMRLVYADNVIQPREEQMIKFVLDVFKISTLDYAKLTALIKDLARVQREINNYIKK